MLLSSYRSKESGCAYGSRKFSNPKGAVIFYLNKLLKKKKKRKEKTGKKKSKVISSETLLILKKKTPKRAKNEVEHVRGILEFYFQGRILVVRAAFLIFSKETEACELSTSFA